ncbi:MAG: hypothetical protein KUG77_19865, partial [Nannocystaceae bacterium]|nr:hypothetical protein [Nannocystaceae bacterium]
LLASSAASDVYKRQPDWLEVHVWGQAFLMNMVRIMVGTLVEVGLGRRSAASIEALFEAPDRTKAGITAPACGLTLIEVRWPPEGERIRDRG